LFDKIARSNFKRPQGAGTVKRMDVLSNPSNTPIQNQLALAVTHTR